MMLAKQNWLKRGLSLILSFVMILCMGAVDGIYTFADDSDAVVINDENLRRAICNELGKEYTEGVEITRAEMESLVKLDASNCDIKDITGITAAVNLESLNLSGNPLDDDKRGSTDNSTMAGDTGFAAFLFDFAAFTKLKYLDLSNCRLGENNLNGRGRDYYYESTPRGIQNIFSILPTLVELNLSDNSFTGKINFLAAVEKPNLKKIDISGNKFCVVQGFYIAGNSPSLEEIDMSDNYIVWDDCVEDFQGVLEKGVKVEVSNQKNLAELYAYGQYNVTRSGSGINKYDVKMNASDTNEIVLKDVLGDSVTMFFATYGDGQTTKVTVGSEENKVTALSPDNLFSSGINGNTIEITGLNEGENRIPVTIMHRNGDTKEYTIVVNSAEFIPGTSEDSAGIADLGVQQMICSKLGKISEAATYVVTKEDVASLKGTLTVPAGTTDYSFLQYATAITGLNCTSTAEDDLSYVENLTALTTLTVGDSKAPIDLSKLTNLKSLTIGETSVPTTIPELDKLTSLTISESRNGEISSIENLSNLKTLVIRDGKTGLLPEGLKDSKITSLQISEAKNAKYTLKDLPSTITSISGRNNVDTSITLYGFATNKKLSVSMNSDSDSPLILVNPEDFTNFTQYAEGGRCTNIPENIGDVSMLSSVGISGSNMRDEVLVLNDSFAKMENVTSFSVNGPIVDEMPEAIGKMTSLKTLKILGSQFTEMNVDLSNTKIETLDLTGNALTKAPEGSLLPATITELTLSKGNISYMNVDYSHMTNLNALYMEDVPLVEFPAKLIQGLPNLMIFYNQGGYYEDIPADAFKNSTNLYVLMAGSYMRLKSSGSDMASFAPVEGSETAKALELLGETSLYFQMGMGMAVLIPYYNGMTEIANYSGLRALNINGTDVTGLPIARSLSMVLPAGTETAEITPTGFLSDSKITIGGQTVNSGETASLPLQEGNNEFKISSTNEFENSVTVSKTTEYTLSVYVGEQSSIEDLSDGNYYQIGCKVLKAGQMVQSMAGSYFDNKAVVRYKNGKYEVRMTSLRSSWMNSYKNALMVDGKRVYVDADVIEEDKQNDICVIRFTTDSLEDIMTINLFVTPMGYSPSCDVHFDLSTIINVTDQMPAVDTADLNAAINKALEITEKNNVYTDESYSNLLAKLEEAQAVAEKPVAQDDADEITEALNYAIETLIIDEQKIADKTDLKAAIDEANAIEKGSHTDTAWNALQEAIAEAQNVYDTLEARQSEVDSAKKSLTIAVTLFNASGEASTLDKNNLADGVYSINADMIKIDRESKSMADNAINHTVKLEVKNGEYFVTLDFRGITIENRFGYLKNLSYYADGYIYNEYGVPVGELVEAEVLSTQKDSDGNDIIDQYNNADTLYPDLVRIKLVPEAIKDENGYVPLHVFVPIMEAIAAGNGDQDVLMKLDWTTLKQTVEDDPDFQPQEPVEQTPAVDVTDSVTGIKVHADKGVFEEGVKLVVNEITSGADYDRAATALEDVGKKFKLYEIYFVDTQGNEVQPNGTVTVSYPVAAGYDIENVALYRINTDGSKTLIKGAVDGGYYTIITKSFSEYALVEKGSTITDSQNTDRVNNAGSSSSDKTSPKTGDTNMMNMWFTLMLMSVGMVSVLLAGKKIRNNKTR